ncbi:hypothetical protein [Streptacidiphilus sp. MAP12-33]|uniref:hypothetical protein n=1 Tax=Streptacidiphilus sp. MAP12-33 TaxID=3156266 RepID=UPI003512340F
MADYVKQFISPDSLGELLAENGVRHIAATGWRMPDGTKVSVYLLAFRSPTTSENVFNAELGTNLATAPTLGLDNSFGQVPFGAADSVSRPAGKAGPALRVGLFSDGDVTGLLELSNPKAVSSVDFAQAMVLQMEMLGG